MKLPRILAALLACGIIALTLAGCSATDNETDRVAQISKRFGPTATITRVLPPEGPFNLTEPRRWYYRVEVGANDRTFWVRAMPAFMPDPWEDNWYLEVYERVPVVGIYRRVML